MEKTIIIRLTTPWKFSTWESPSLKKEIVDQVKKLNPPQGYYLIFVLNIINTPEMDLSLHLSFLWKKQRNILLPIDHLRITNGEEDLAKYKNHLLVEYLNELSKGEEIYLSQETISKREQPAPEEPKEKEDLMYTNPIKYLNLYYCGNLYKYLDESVGRKKIVFTY